MSIATEHFGPLSEEQLISDSTALLIPGDRATWTATVSNNRSEFSFPFTFNKTEVVFALDNSFKFDNNVEITGADGATIATNRVNDKLSILVDGANAKQFTLTFSATVKEVTEPRAIHIGQIVSSVPLRDAGNVEILVGTPDDSSQPVFSQPPTPSSLQYLFYLFPTRALTDGIVGSDGALISADSDTYGSVYPGEAIFYEATFHANAISEEAATLTATITADPNAPFSLSADLNDTSGIVVENNTLGTVKSIRRTANTVTVTVEVPGMNGDINAEIGEVNVRIPGTVSPTVSGDHISGLANASAITTSGVSLVEFQYMEIFMKDAGMSEEEILADGNMGVLTVIRP